MCVSQLRYDDNSTASISDADKMKLIQRLNASSPLTPVVKWRGSKGDGLGEDDEAEEIVIDEQSVEGLTETRVREIVDEARETRANEVKKLGKEMKEMKDEMQKELKTLKADSKKLIQIEVKKLDDRYKAEIKKNKDDLDIEIKKREEIITEQKERLDKIEVGAKKKQEDLMKEIVELKEELENYRKVLVSNGSTLKRLSSLVHFNDDGYRSKQYPYWLISIATTL